MVVKEGLVTALDILQQTGERLGVIKSAEIREKERTEETDRFISQFTSEPVGVVRERIEKRISKPTERHAMVDRYRELWDMLPDLNRGRQDPKYLLRLYTTSIELHSLGLFGENSQKINLFEPIPLNPKDIEVITKLQDIARLVRQSRFETATNQLGETPILVGSNCDAGAFDGHNHEVLIATCLVVDEIRELIPSLSSNPSYKDTLKAIACVELGHIAGKFSDSLFEGERLKVAATFLAAFLPSEKFPSFLEFMPRQAK